MTRIKSINVNGDEFVCADFNVIVGGNNIGKTVFIKELFQCVKDVSIQISNKWIKGASLSIDDPADVFFDLFPILKEKDFAAIGGIDQYVTSFTRPLQNWNEHVWNFVQKNDHSTINISKDNKEQVNYFWKFLTPMISQFEGCGARLKTEEFRTTISNLNSDNDENIVGHLFRTENDLDGMFQKLRDHIKRVFEIEICFDDLEQAIKVLRLLPDRYPTREETANRRSKAYAQFWNEQSSVMAEQGDGIRAYVWLCFLFFNPVKSLIFIDEPETFLHPPQRRALGAYLRQQAGKQGKQVFIVTHDPEFLRGAASAIDGGSMKAFYLRGNTNRECVDVDLGNPEFGSRAHNEQMLGGFFHSMTVCCEAEDDRVVYEYATRKFFGEQKDIHWIGCNGKNETRERYVQLKKYQIPSCCILDFDALLDEELKNKLSTFGVSSEVQKSLEASLEKIIVATSESDGNGGIKRNTLGEELKIKGIGSSLLPSSTIKDDVKLSIEILERVGIFIVPCGEFESWVADVKHKDGRKIQKMINQIDGSSNTDGLRNFLNSVLTYQAL